MNKSNTVCKYYSKRSDLEPGQSFAASATMAKTLEPAAAFCWYFKSLSILKTHAEVLLATHRFIVMNENFQNI